MDELYDKAEAEQKTYVGKTIAVTWAMIGDGDDIYDRYFPTDSPLLIRVDESFTNNESDPDAENGLLDTYYNGEALPGQLEPDEHVAWFDGPTYHLDGRVETPTWERVSG